MSNLLTKIVIDSTAKLSSKESDLDSANCSPDEMPVLPALPYAQADQFPPMDLYEEFMVEPGSKVMLGDIDPAYHGKYESREGALPEIRFLLEKIVRLQYVMYAQKKHSLLVLLQGLDASGKDGVIRHILSAINPAACQVVAFKRPKPEDLDHDFLWRVHPHLPAKGEVSIFNRSHYEDVLIVRVHQLAEVQRWSQRYELINDFERLVVADNDTTILKFFLYISKKEQLHRFKQRLDDPLRRWKISEADYKERAYWSEYMDAFEDMIHKTSTRFAPWFIIPSNHKWFRDLAVSQIITRALEKLDMRIPEPAVDINHIARLYHTAEV